MLVHNAVVKDLLPRSWLVIDWEFDETSQNMSSFRSTQPLPLCLSYLKKVRAKQCLQNVQMSTLVQVGGVTLVHFGDDGRKKNRKIQK